MRLDSPPSPIVSESAYLFYDEFTRYADGALSGKSPAVGANAWVTTGAGVAGESVVSGAWASTGAGVAYAVMHLGATPWEYGAVFSSTDGTTFLPVIACINDYTTYGFNAMYHPLVNTSDPTQCVWSPTYFDTSSRSGGTDVTGGALAWTTSGYGKFALSANVQYRYRIIINAPYVDHVIEKLDGTVIATARVYDPIITSVIGPWMFIEVTGTNRNFRWHSAYARSKPASESKTYRRLLAGAEATPVGMLTPAGGNFTHVHAGPGTPVGVLSARYDGSQTAYRPGVYSSAGAAEFQIKPEVSGNVGRLLVYNGAGGIAKIEHDGAFALNLIGNSGSAFLTKPANAGTPYFAAAVGVGGSAGPTWTSGSGSPEGVVTAPVGSLYSRTNGGASTSLYVKESGASNTGWIAK